jgi:hypothetical protein
MPSTTLLYGAGCRSVRASTHHVRTGDHGMFVAKPTLRRQKAASILITAALLIFCIPVGAQCASTVSAGEFLRRAVNAELQAQAADHTHWTYQVKAGAPGKERVKLVVETRDGDLERLQSLNGQPITPEQERQEDRRIASIVNKPKSHERNKQRREQAEDGRKTDELFRMLPSAVISSYGECRGDLVEILFQPNSNFHPSSREDAVFHQMAGRIWINQRENRLAEIEGHLIEGVKFAGGLLGHLDKGGEFHVRQSEVTPDHWEITLLHVNMHGKALFFKTISVQENETRTNYQPVPGNLTLSEAAQQLQKRGVAKSKEALSSLQPPR